MAILRDLTVRDFILKADLDLPEEQRTIFHLRPLSSRDATRIDDMQEFLVSGEEGKARVVSNNAAAIRCEKVRTALVGWTNARTTAGPETFKSETAMDLILPFIMELSEEVDRLSTLTGQEVKNLPSQQLGISTETKSK